MAKRFTDTEKWKKPFIRGLQGAYKLLWFYIVDDCDVAGIWQTDFEVASLRIGEPIDPEKAKEIFADRVVFLEHGQKWFLPAFIEFQYGKLQENNRAHTKAISTLKRYGLIDKDFNIKPLTSPLQGAMVEVKEKEEDKVKEKEQVKEGEPEKVLTYPFSSDEFMSMWANWKEYKNKEFKFKYKSIQSEQASLSELSNLANGEEDVGLAIIRQSMAKGWKGFFELDKNFNNGKGNSSNQQSADSKAEAMERGFALADKMYGNRGNG